MDVGKIRKGRVAWRGLVSKFVFSWIQFGLE